MTLAGFAKASCTWPPSRSIIAGPPPLYGTCCIFTPASISNMTADRCVAPPVLEEA
jgi:hypothetical protein